MKIVSYHYEGQNLLSTFNKDGCVSTKSLQDIHFQYETIQRKGKGKGALQFKGLELTNFLKK
jgi:hypothetical protein